MTTTASHTIDFAIARSVQENRTVVVSAAEEGIPLDHLSTALAIESDDAAELGEGASEGWGEDEDGNSWRVEVRQ